jgi:hypothetical protein
MFQGYRLFGASRTDTVPPFHVILLTFISGLSSPRNFPFRFLLHHYILFDKFLLTDEAPELQILVYSGK